MDEILESVMTEIKSIVDRAEYWQVAQIERRVKEALELAYKKGRLDQDYAHNGPRKINLYD